MTSEQPPTESAASDATAETPAAPPAPDATAESPSPAAPDATIESPSPAAPPASSEPSKGGPSITLGFGQIVAALGAIAVGVACLLDWIAAEAGITAAVKAHDIPLEFLWSNSNFARGSTSILAALIPIAFVIAISAAVPTVRLVGLIAGIAALVVAGLYAYQLNDLIDGRHVGGLFDRLGIGAYFVAAGGVLAILGALLPRPAPTA
jgi:hypothetical protein